MTDLDLLTGTPAIAEFLGLRPRRIEEMIRKKTLPIFKLEGRWTARKSTLLGCIDSLEAEAAAKAEAAAAAKAEAAKSRRVAE